MLQESPPCLKSKACEARPVDDEASRVWRRGQNIQGVCRRIFWVPQELGGPRSGGGIHLNAVGATLCGRPQKRNPEGVTDEVSTPSNLKQPVIHTESPSLF